MDKTKGEALQRVNEMRRNPVKGLDAYTGSCSALCASIGGPTTSPPIRLSDRNRLPR